MPGGGTRPARARWSALRRVDRWERPQCEAGSGLAVERELPVPCDHRTPKSADSVTAGRRRGHRTCRGFLVRSGITQGRTPATLSLVKVRAACAGGAADPWTTSSTGSRTECGGRAPGSFSSPATSGPPPCPWPGDPPRLWSAEERRVAQRRSPLDMHLDVQKRELLVRSDGDTAF